MIIVGADESGTGAWAGPFTVCAVAIHDHDQAELRKLGVTDSKRVPDAKRRALINDIVDIAIVARCEFVSIEEMRGKNLKDVWRAAMLQAIIAVAKGREARVIVDGNVDSRLKTLAKIHGIKIDFMVKADAKEVVVGAASIVAKTMRNDAMIRLHDEYPEYEWAINAGYPSPQHQALLAEKGYTKHHRSWWKNFTGISERK